MIVMFFLAIIVVLYVWEVRFFVVYVIKKYRGDKSARIFAGRLISLIHVVALVGIGCMLYGFLVEPYWIEVNTYHIETDKLSQGSFRVVHISDLHCDPKRRAENTLVELVNGLDPDIIVFTGDCVNSSDGVAVFKDTVTKLRARQAKLAVEGNWDIGYVGDTDLFGGTGFKLLDNDIVTFEDEGETLYISGLSCKNPRGYRGLLEGIPERDFSIFLYHYSDFIEDMDDLNVDIYLCGHTHGGQIRLPFYGALITSSILGKRFEMGYYRVEQTHLYVSRGIGLEGMGAPRLRFLCPPEITLFTIGGL